VSTVRRIGLWLPVVAFMAALFVASAQSVPSAAPQVWDKLLHAVAYAVFGFFCLRATHGGVKRPRPGPTLWALLLALGYGAFDEWHQSWVPGRHPSVADWVADLVGVAIALCALHVWARWLERRRRRLADR
jgi:VanZ family protein